MRKLTAACFAAAAVAAMIAPASAQTLAECRAVTDSLARLTCYDKIPLDGAEAVEAAIPDKPATVSLVSADLKHEGKNYDRDIFSPRITLRPTYHNDSDKTVVGIRHRIIVKDAFGEAVIDSVDNLDIRIPPGKTVKSEMFYVWEDNQFIPRQPYDRLLGPVTNGTAKAESIVKTVIYEDGTSDNF